MEGPSTGNKSIFMCKLCNLFSPNQSELLSHVSEKHSEEGIKVDDIIIPLRPLTTPSNLNKNGEELLVVKRKRGRPKGSTKKCYVDEELAESSNCPPNEDVPPGPEEAGGQGEVPPDSLECRKCNRKFSNSRQLRKHICILVKPEDTEEGDPGNDSDVDLDRREDEREKAPKRQRLQRSEKSLSAKDTDQVSGAKNPIISVVLTAHEAIPGATKIVPVEAASSKTEQLTNPETVVSDSSQRRGYQEYAIQQTPYEQPMKSNRLSATQLKIFTCEYCNKVFKFKHSLQAHLRIHTNEKPYKCSFCSYASAIKANLNVHLRKHTGEKFACDYCPFTCLSKGHLKVHVERVHKKIKQHCRFCKKKYSDVKNLIKHIKEAHDLQDKKVKEVFDELRLMTREGKRQLLYDCHICERKFKNELDRDRHMLVHGDERPFACELCGHGATKYQALELHIRKHPFVYVCSKCLKKFVSSIRLRSHIKEAHRDLPEASLFNSSINQSFCLLEPGGDIQQEALGEELSQTAAELSLLNSKELCILKKPVCTSDLNAVEGSQHDNSGVKDKTTSSPALDLEAPPVADTADALCSSSTELVSPDAFPDSVPDGFLQKDASSELAEERILLEKEGEVFPDPSQNTHNEVIPLSGEGGANINVNGQVPQCAPDVEESGQTICLNTQEADVATTEEVETTVQLPASESSAAVVDKSDFCPASSENRTGAAAFMQILDSLQKRQMNTALCEKIRKVYGDLECEYCGKLFWYQVHYDMHVRTHTREHLYYCSQCSYSSITKNCLKRHVIQKHSNILLKCPTEDCDYSTPDKYKLQAHLKVHTDLDKKSYSCPVCDKSFSEDRLIKSHIKTNHPEVSMNTISEIVGRRVQLKGLIGKRAMKCPYCNFYFMKNGSDLQRHIWAHEGIKPFKCSLCEYATRSKSNLKAHMNRHSTEKTHLCDMCGKKFKSKGTLKSHKLLHTADGKQFKCTVCDYTAAQKPQLLRHMEQHASFKPFRCAHCHYSCNISGSLKRHYNRKHPYEEYVNAGSGELPTEALLQQGGIKCPVCNFVYGTKWECNRHLKNKHGLRLVERDGEMKWEQTTEISDEETSSYLQITEAGDMQGAQAAVAALQDLRHTSENGGRFDPTAVNILQQIIELGSEPHDATAVASVVAMAPGTVTVVKQVTEEEQPTSHTVMIQESLQQASVELTEEHHLVVSSDDMEGLGTVTVYTQGGEASELIVYVQEAMQAVGEQAEEQEPSI
ncbi:zinc finger protein ZFAT isoform X1 [Anolis carolinensis]|uniref:Zinc finger protein ZFAT n=2 Tax=Anolis carolinensis TaxID=28377 RepID=G1KLS0_ANOCA|nr:PREDICTED: zinc finger protein ZFAT isoform X1 [Anolis carolinensis]XP_008106394.1 PREDICTED: zinc finger protein ZFAT isoform X1 [Anolis carolinensis]XP_008106395.1 PREDICTED: zinc finger protein ZFAT isoform X1 [Anolis carolinensis]|eukprot:XP_003219437.1 PREDICTED: zinc finger protein ZFAT isoform X1 [Anolis carolinensis]